MPNLILEMLERVRNAVIAERRHPMELIISSERYDNMMCEICRSDPALCSDADRKRLEDEKWEQRRYELVRDIIAANSGHYVPADELVDQVDRIIRNLRETKDDPSA